MSTTSGFSIVRYPAYMVSLPDCEHMEHNANLAEALGAPREDATISGSAETHCATVRRVAPWHKRDELQRRPGA